MINLTNLYSLWMLSYPSSLGCYTISVYSQITSGQDGGSGDITSQHTLLQTLEATSFQLDPEAGSFLPGNT